MFRIIFALILLSLAVPISPAQTQDKEYKISPRDKAELQRLSKRFVRRMQRTRDVAPLMAEFYLRDRRVLMAELAAFTNYNESHPLKLSGTQWIRYEIVKTNMIYLMELNKIVSGSHDFSKILSTPVAKELNDLFDENSGTDDPSSKQYLAELPKLETALSKARMELRKRNYETSPAYKREWDSRTKNGGYNYVIDSNMYWDPRYDDHRVSAEMKRKYPMGVRTYTVTTPPGLAPSFIKEHGRFRIVLVWVYPWD
jgi:hypothetical protein